MRPAGRGDLESLYFTYPQFEAPVRPAEPNTRAKVVIVGAGPIGMVAALTLARHGIASVLLEAKATFNDGSRAICIARQSMHIFEALGVADAFLANALPYVSGRTFFRGEEILEFFMADSGDQKHRPMYNLQQQYIEQFLHAGVAQSKLVDLRWQSRVSAVEDIASGVRLTVEDPHGSYTLDTDWVLAADGARSAIRTMRGLRLKGENYEGRYVIADIRLSHPRKVERLALFDPASRPGGTVLIHQQPKNIWRIDYQLRHNEPEAEALTEASIRAGIAGVLRDIGVDAPWDLEWWSVYSANTLLLDDYRDGRIFFIGDSAHIVPIFGVRGLNNGIADAHNIGWKLAAVLSGEASERVLDSYTPERRGATFDVFANASKSARFMTPPTRGWSLMRDAALLLALKYPFAGAFANPRNMTPYTYAESPMTRADTDLFSAGPKPGEAAHSAPLDGGGFLHDRLGTGFTVLAFGEAAHLAALQGHVPAIDVITLPSNSAAARAYGADPHALYLIRPDLHIAARWKTATADDIRSAVAALLGKTGHPS
jgi:3-(3-hydroxy-phenyl)propionate hydroxylase